MREKWSNCYRVGGVGGNVKIRSKFDSKLHMRLPFDHFTLLADILFFILHCNLLLFVTEIHSICFESLFDTDFNYETHILVTFLKSAESFMSFIFDFLKNLVCFVLQISKTEIVPR